MRTKVLAVASGGGHWIQLRRLATAFDGSDIAYVTTLEGYREQVGPARFHLVSDASRWDRIGLIKLVFQIIMILIRERPQVVISTGAAPGYFALRLGRLLGARTIWIDSIANAEQLSLGGKKIGKHADLWLTQWEHLARPEGPHFEGAVL